jgi:hypothetical protein
LGIDGFRLAVGGPMNFLDSAWLFLVGKRRQLDRNSAMCRFVQGTHDPDIRQAFKSGRFRRSVLENAIREISNLCGKLITLGKRSFLFPSTKNDFMLYIHCIFVCWIRS